MARRGLLIVSSDDFGHDRAATDRAVDCFRAGLITSASAMVFMEDSRRASELAREARLPAGLHINLSEPYTETAAPEEARARQARLARRFGPDQRRRLMRWLYDPGIQRDVEACVAEQLEEFRRLYGDEPTHIDGHQHVHLCPNVFMARALDGGVRARSVLEKYPARHSPLAVARLARHRLIARRFRSPQYLFDIADAGPDLLRMADHATVEVMAHAGF